MAYASDAIGHDRTEQLIGMLPGIDREINRGDKDAVFATLTVIEQLDQSIFPHVLDPEVKDEFQKLTEQLVPVMAKVQETNSLEPLKEFIYSARPDMEKVVNEE